MWSTLTSSLWTHTRRRANRGRPPWSFTEAEATKAHTHITQLLELLARSGYAWFSVNYRSPEHVAEAIHFIRCPGRFNITNEIVLIGEDAGAQVALELSAASGFQGVVTFGAKLSPPDDRGSENRLSSVPPPSEPDRRISRIRLSSL